MEISECLQCLTHTFNLYVRKKLLKENVKKCIEF